MSAGIQGLFMRFFIQCLYKTLSPERGLQARRSFWSFCRFRLTRRTLFALLFGSRPLSLPRSPNHLTHRIAIDSEGGRASRRPFYDRCAHHHHGSMLGSWFDFAELRFVLVLCARDERSVWGFSGSPPQRV